MFVMQVKSQKITQTEIIIIIANRYMVTIHIDMLYNHYNTYLCAVRCSDWTRLRFASYHYLHVYI